MMESHFREVMIVLCSLKPAKKARKDSIGAAGAWQSRNLSRYRKEPRRSWPPPRPNGESTE
jgi:hypothetical protein